MKTRTSLNRMGTWPLRILALSSVLGLPGICCGDDANGEAAAAVTPPPDQAAGAKAENPEEPASDAVPAATDQPGKEQEQAEEAKPDEPQPVGKLKIRKGIGRPPGLRDNAIAVPGDRMIGGMIEMMPDQALNQAAVANQEEIKKRIEEHQQRIVKQLLPLLHRELYFVHLVCDTTAEERKQLLAIGESELTRLAATAAQRVEQPVPELVPAGIAFEMPVVPMPPETEVVRRLQDKLLQAVAKNLGEQRATRLRTEFESRVTVQRQVPVDRIVAQLDALLALSPQQQQEIRERMLAGFREEWITLSPHFDARYFPDVQLPPGVLMALNNAQRKRFSTLPRVSFQHVNELPVQINPGEKPDCWNEALKQLDLAEQTRGANR